MTDDPFLITLTAAGHDLGGFKAHQRRAVHLLRPDQPDRAAAVAGEK